MVDSPLPRVAPGFEWHETPVGPVLRASALQPFADHAFTTRALRFREPTLAADEGRLAGLLGLPPPAVVWGRQVHGRTVTVVRAGEAVAGRPEADGFVSTDPVRAVAVRVADCVPILLADRQGRVVAAIHAGWRGTCAGVSAATVRAIEATGTAGRELVAAIGPSIGPCCYQVDEHVRAAFLDDPAGARSGRAERAERWFHADGPGHWRLDLWQANADQLEAAGVAPSAIHLAGVCTADHLDWCFSYRREGADTGRLAAAIRARRGPAV